MSWATTYIKKLQAGETVQFRPRGNSMTPRIWSGELCTVKPVDANTVKPTDIVLCNVHGKHYLHIVKARQGNRFQIGNNSGHINGWIGPNHIYGILVKVES